ncbi:MAG: NINE protein [Bacteroidota bacterium]
MRNKTVAAILAFIMGIFGVHRFYLGQRVVGILHFFMFFITFMITVSEPVEFPPIIIPFLIGFVDAVLLFVMPQVEFDDKYNAPLRRKVQRNKAKRQARAEKNNYSYEQRAPKGELKKEGIRLFRSYAYEEALEAFLGALEEKPDDPTLHFNLACTYSMLEEADQAFIHLEDAVHYGFKDIDRIHSHDALAFLRSHPQFDAFIENGYKTVKSISVSSRKDEELDLNGNPQMNSLLKQLRDLAELRDKGILTNEEFAQQKHKLLNNE